MANTVENTLNKIGNTLESIFGTTSPQQPTSNKGDGKQTCLEKYGIEARKYHILRNEWRKDLEYSKPLVDAEYLIQTEFKIGDSPEEIRQKQESDRIGQITRERDMVAEAQRKALKKAEKAEAAAAKKEAKLGKIAQKDNTSTTQFETSEGLHNWSNDELM